MAQDLSRGSVHKMFVGEQVPKPVLQVIDIKKIQPPPSQAPQPQSANTERYRLVISDGIHFQQSMLATQLNDLIKEDVVSPRCLIRLVDYICNQVHGRRIVIILKLERVALPLPDIIGPPTSIEQAMGNVKQESSNQQQSHQPLQQPKPTPSYPNNSYTQPKSEPVKNEYNNNNNNNNNHYNQTQHQQQSHSNQPSHSSYNQQGSTDLNQSPLFPISNLNPYQSRWTIKARVMTKSDIRHWSNAKGKGKLFYIELVDSSGEIRATAFNAVADQFYPLFEVGKVYYISKCSIKFADKRYSNLKSEYELTLESFSMVQVCEEKQSDDIPQVNYSFIDISSINEIPKDTVVDVIGIITNVEDIITITTKSGSSVPKRTIKILDTSKTQIDVSLWNNSAESFGGMPGHIVAVKGVRVSEWNGKSLTAAGTTIVTLNPSIPEAEKLSKWYDTQGGNLQVESLSAMPGQKPKQMENRPTVTKLLSQVKEEGLGFQDQPDFFSTVATITFIKHDTPPIYPACSTPQCNRKVTKQGNGWFCEKCNAPCEPIYRYVLSLSAADHTDSTRFSSFNEVAEKILQVSANDLNNLKSKNEGAYEAVFVDSLFSSYRFKIRAKQETYNDETGVKYVILEASPLNYVDESKQLLNEINKYNP